MPAKEKDNSIFVSLICNVLLAIGKGVTGLLANSNALVADAIHSTTDVIAFFINYRACENCQMYGRTVKKSTKESLRPRDGQHITWVFSSLRSAWLFVFTIL